MEIEVNRPKQYHDKIRDYTLWADSKKIGKVKPNSLTNYTRNESINYGKMNTYNYNKQKSSIH